MKHLIKRLLRERGYRIQHYQGEALFFEVAEFLSRFSYSVFDLYDLYRATNGQLRYCDALFVSKQFRNGVIDKFRAET